MGTKQVFLSTFSSRSQQCPEEGAVCSECTEFSMWNAVADCSHAVPIQVVCEVFVRGYI